VVNTRQFGERLTSRVLVNRMESLFKKRLTEEGVAEEDRVSKVVKGNGYSSAWRRNCLMEVLNECG
jgi:hypothetical protein